jgi:penicillin-binding protein 1A
VKYAGDPPGYGWSDDPEAEKKRERRKRIAAVAGVLAGVLLLAFSWLWVAPCGFGGCAPVSDLDRYQAEGSELLDLSGEPFGTLATVNRRIVSLDSLPAYLPQAFLAVEDRRFFDHHGVDWKRMGAAVRSVLTPGERAEGGSTISMQLARNLFPDRLSYRDRTVRRKLMEIRVARQLERTFSKRKILELYLNHIYLGDGSYGVEAAARDFFGKPAAELTLAEAATLGGLPKAPSLLNPRADSAAARARRDLVLEQMAEARFVSEAQAREAGERPLELARSQRSRGDQFAPWFVERVRQELESEVGESFYTAGLRVYTTLDRSAQNASEAELSRQLERIEGGAYGAYRHPVYNDGDSTPNGRTPYLQGMVALLDVRSGEVRALVGGRDFEQSEFDRASQAVRQPGSAFKPFVYLAALERGHPPTERLQDAPVRLAISRGRYWEPRNYTGRYEGPMTLRNALARSKNIVTVRLAEEIGRPAVAREARDLGISTDIPDYPATTLGAAGVRPLELVTAYAAFGNGGYRVRPHFVRRIEDRDGRVLWEAPVGRTRVVDPAAAFVLTSMLRDVVDRGTGTAVRAVGFRGPAAGKTGTTNGATDVWFVGYTPELVAGVWMGLDRPQTIVRGGTGGELAAPVWGRLMKRIYAGREMPAPWPRPGGVVSATADRQTGEVVGAGCPAGGATYTEYFVNYAPARGACSDRGIFWAGVDTLGYPYDDEYGAYELPPDTFTLDAAARGIDWPELEGPRERADAGGGRIIELPPSAGDTSASRPAERSVAADPAATQPPPKLLGVPVRRGQSPGDSTGSP